MASDVDKKIIIMITVLSIICGGIILFWVSYKDIEQQHMSFKWHQQKLRDEIKMHRSEDTSYPTPMIGYSHGD